MAASRRARPASLTAAAVATYGTNLTVAVLSLGNVIVIGRVLGPSGRGTVAFLTTVAYLTSQLAALGVAEANVNFSSRNPDSTPRLATNSVLFAALFGLLSAGVVAGLMALVPAFGGPATRSLRVAALASVPVLMLGAQLMKLMYGHYAFTVANLAWVAPPVVNLVANAALAGAGVLSAGLALGSWIAGQVASSMIVLWFVVTRLGGLGRPDLRLARQTLAFGLRAHLGIVLSLANYRLDQWILGVISSARQLGLYSVAVAWSEALFFLPTTLAMVHRPDLVRHERGLAARQAAAVFRAAAVVTIVMGAAMALVAPVLCTTVFGHAFAGSVAQLRVLTVGAVGVVAMKLLGNALVAQGRPLRQTLAILSSFAVILALDLALIPSLGGLGAAIASSVAYGLGGLMAGAVFARTFALPARELVPRWGDVRQLLRR